VLHNGLFDTDISDGNYSIGGFLVQKPSSQIREETKTKCTQSLSFIKNKEPD